MKKILFVIPNLGGGGAEKVLVNLVNFLDKSKYEIEIKTLFSENINRKFLKDNIKLTTCFGKQFRGNRILFKLFSPKFLYKKLIKGNYDIIVSYLEGPGERIVSACTNPDTKLVNWIHVEQHDIKTGAASYRSVKEFYKSISRFNFTAFVSETIKDDYLGFVDLHHKNGVIYNTNDVGYIINKSIEKIDENVLPVGLNVFSVGRLTPAKGFDRLIKIHKKLISEGLKHNLIILGEGEQKEELLLLCKGLGVDDSVHFLGFKSNPYKYLSHADLFVCSSRREGFSTAVTEALILGVPIVSTLCSGAEELLGKNNEFGIICENSEYGIYKGMRKMLATHEILKKYKELARIRGKAFSIESTVTKVEELFDRL